MTAKKNPNSGPFQLTDKDYYVQAKYYLETARHKRDNNKPLNAKDDLLTAIDLNHKGIAANPSEPMRASLHAAAAVAGLELAGLLIDHIPIDTRSIMTALNQAQTDVEQALALNAPHPDVVNARLADIHYRRAAITKKDADYQSSIAAYSRAIEVGQGNIVLDPSNGKWYERQANRFMRASQIESMYAITLRENDEISRSLKHHERADAKSATALSMRPKKEPRRSRALILAERGVTTLLINDLQLAVELAREAHRLHPSSAAINFACGRIMRAAGRYHDAIVHLSTTLEAAPDHNAALIELGDAYANINLPSEASRFYERAADVGEPSPRLVNALASALFQTNETDRAMNWLRYEIEMHPDDAEAHYNLARIHNSLEKYEIALTHADATLNLDPHNALSHMIKAQILTNLNMAHEAKPEQSEPLAAFREAHRLDPDNDAITVELARCYIAHNLPREAQQLLADAMTRQTVQALYLHLNLKNADTDIAPTSATR